MRSRGIDDLGAVKPPDLRALLADEASHRPAVSSQARTIAALKGFFRFLVENEVIERDPAAVLRTVVPCARERRERDAPPFMGKAASDRVARPPAEGADTWRMSRALSLFVVAVVAAAALPEPDHAAVVPMCDGSLLRLSRGDPPAPETGEHPATFDLRNAARRACALVGYPGVRLFDRRGVLPFRYQWGGPYSFTNESPRRVFLRAGARASFVVAQYRCDGRVLRGARAIQIYPPGGMSAARFRLPRDLFTYCKAVRGPNSRDPGNRIYIGPVRTPL